MSIWGNIKGFLRALRSGSGLNPNQRPSDSLAMTMKYSTHVRGELGGGLSRASTEDQHEIVVKGHENYQKSFDEAD